MFFFLLTRFSELSYVQPIHNIKRVNTQFQLEDHISGIAFLAPKRNKSLLCINLNYNKFETALSRERTHIFLEGNFSVYQAL